MRHTIPFEIQVFEIIALDNRCIIGLYLGRRVKGLRQPLKILHVQGFRATAAIDGRHLKPGLKHMRVKTRIPHRIE